MERPAPPPLPRWTEKDGNRFAWIIEQARKAREARSSYFERFRAEHRRNPLAEETPRKG